MGLGPKMFLGAFSPGMRFFPETSILAECLNVLDLLNSESVFCPLDPKDTGSIHEKRIFVRVDLSNVDGKFYFGVLTFTPAGSLKLRPTTWDSKLGEK